MTTASPLKSVSLAGVVRLTLVLIVAAAIGIAIGAGTAYIVPAAEASDVLVGISVFCLWILVEFVFFLTADILGVSSKVARLLVPLFLVCAFFVTWFVLKPFG